MCYRNFRIENDPFPSSHLYRFICYWLGFYIRLTKIWNDICLRWYQVLLKGKCLCLCFISFHSFYLLMKRSNSKHQRSGRKQFQLKKSQVRYKKINEDMKHYNFWVLLGDLMNAIETIILFRLLLCIIRYFSMTRAVISLARPRIQYSDLYKRCCV